MTIDDPSVLASLADSLADIEGVTETIDQIVSFAVQEIDTTYGGITLIKSGGIDIASHTEPSSALSV